MAAANSFEKRCRDPAPVRRDGLAFEQDLPFIGQEESDNQRNQSRLVDPERPTTQTNSFLLILRLMLRRTGSPGSNQG